MEQEREQALLAQLFGSSEYYSADRLFASTGIYAPRNEGQ